MCNGTGYKDIGVCWREELETENLEEVVEQLFLQVRPLFQKLHAYVRFKLSAVYDLDPLGLLPAHLLGKFNSLRPGLLC